MISVDIRERHLNAMRAALTSGIALVVCVVDDVPVRDFLEATTAALVKIAANLDSGQQTPTAEGVFRATQTETDNFDRG
jgi:hypothetical protein